MTAATKLVLFSIVVACAPLVLSDTIVFPGPTEKEDESERQEVSIYSLSDKFILITFVHHCFMYFKIKLTEYRKNTMINNEYLLLCL